MSFEQTRTIEFSQPFRQIISMVVVLILVAIGVYFLYGPIETVFNANPYLNGFIIAVFVFGVVSCFLQVFRLMASVNWLEGFAIDRPGHEFVEPPRLLVSLSTLLRDRRARASLTATSTKSILDSVATRLDEQRDINRYIVNVLILVGLLGTFWGLSNVVPGIVETLRSLAPREGEQSLDVFNNLMEGLNEQLDGMGTAFASSLLGLAGSLVVGLLDLFAGHGQNRFYRDLEEWMSSITRIAYSGEGDASGAAGVTAELIDRTTDQIALLADLMKRSEQRSLETEDNLEKLVGSIASLTDRMREDRRSMMGAPRAGAMADDGEMARRLERIAVAQERVAQLLESQDREEEGQDAESRLRLRNIDMQLLRILEEISAGRQDAIAEIRMDIARLTNTIIELGGGEGR